MHQISPSAKDKRDDSESIGFVVQTKPPSIDPPAVTATRGNVYDHSDSFLLAILFFLFFFTSALIMGGKKTTIYSERMNTLWLEVGGMG